MSKFESINQIYLLLLRVYAHVVGRDPYNRVSIDCTITEAFLCTTLVAAFWLKDAEMSDMCKK